MSRMAIKNELQGELASNLAQLNAHILSILPKISLQKMRKLVSLLARKLIDYDLVGYKK